MEVKPTNSAPQSCYFRIIAGALGGLLLVMVLFFERSGAEGALHFKAGVGSRPPWRMDEPSFTEFRHFEWDGPTGSNTSGRFLGLRVGKVCLWLELINGSDIER